MTYALSANFRQGATHVHELPMCRRLSGELNIAVHPTRHRSYPSQTGNFFATTTFFKLTYFGRPSLP